MSSLIIAVGVPKLVTRISEAMVDVWTRVEVPSVTVRIVFARLKVCVKHPISPFTSVGTELASPPPPVTLTKLQAETLFPQLLRAKLDINEKS